MALARTISSVYPKFIVIVIWFVLKMASTAKVEIAIQPIEFGEGPHWNVETQTLYLVNCFTKPKFVQYTPATNKVKQVLVQESRSPSFIIPVRGTTDQFVVALDNTIELILWNDDAKDGDYYTTLETLASANLRFNDGKCDSTGRLWTGSMRIPPEGAQFTQPIGSVYSLEGRGQLVKHVDGIRLSNGFAFNEAAKKLYYIDTVKRTVDQFDFEPQNGSISNRQVLFDVATHDLPGNPDGMTIDTDGNLWVALFEGSRVIKIDGKQTETLLETIHIPALQVTSVSWGGPNLDELFVTTGARGDNDTMLPPNNGATFKVTGTGSRGFPPNSFKL